MVKFDIVSGFLGAGKTTFIKKVLKSLNHEKVVIIENEFGEVSVDREVLEIQGFDVYELSNGCVCCKLKGDFLLTLRDILSQDIDRIIFEPSGIFILDEIFDIFKDSQISAKCFINSVTTIVDAGSFSKHVQSYSYFFKSQISNATSIVLSKSQLLKPNEVSKVVEALRLLNKDAKILTKDWVDLSPTDLLCLLNENPKYLPPDVTATHSAGHDFESLGFRPTGIFARRQLESILEKCKNGVYGNILRGKGIIRSLDTFLEFQYIDGQYTISTSKNITSGVVSFIGSNLQKDTLSTVFQ